jgi:hypothetical protein
MQIFIQNRTTGLFYTSSNGWSKDLRKARSFVSALQAWDFCGKRSLEDTEIIFKAPKEAPRAIISYGHFNPRFEVKNLQPAF